MDVLAYALSPPVTIVRFHPLAVGFVEVEGHLAEGLVRSDWHESILKVCTTTNEDVLYYINAMQQPLRKILGRRWQYDLSDLHLNQFQQTKSCSLPEFDLALADPDFVGVVAAGEEEDEFLVAGVA